MEERVNKILNLEEEFLSTFTKERNKTYPQSSLTYRKLREDDYDRGFFETLSNLTVVGNTTKEKYVERFQKLNLSHSDVYKIIVCVDDKTDKIIASGTVFFEFKFIRNMGVCGHIEDIAVRKNYHSQNIGLHLIFCLKEISKLNHCYKIILDCRQELTKFYGKNEFKQKEIQMAWYNDQIVGGELSKNIVPVALSRL